MDSRAGVDWVGDGDAAALPPIVGLFSFSDYSKRYFRYNIGMNDNNQDANTQPTATRLEYTGLEVQIGTGFGGMKPIAQHGSIVMIDGALTLYDSNGGIIESAPLQQISVKRLWFTMGATAMLTMNGHKYSVAVGNGKFLGVPLASLGAASSGTAGFCQAFREMTTPVQR
jgi:hypothetical protein